MFLGLLGGRWGHDTEMDMDMEIISGLNFIWNFQLEVTQEYKNHRENLRQIHIWYIH